MTFELTVDLEDLNRQAILLDNFDEIARRHLRPALQQSTEELRASWRDVISVVSGIYEASISGRVTSIVGLNSKAKVSATARRDGKFPYPAALESSPSTGRAVRRYIWRGGSAAGSPARGTLARIFQAQAERVVRRVIAAVEAIMRDLAIPED